MVMADWSGVISQCTIDSWKEALVAALTHSSDQSPLLCERLGERLQIESGGDSAIVKNSILCYICAGNIERIVDAWIAINGCDSTDDSEKLQELVEIVVLLNKALERQGKHISVYGKYAELLSKYASLLASQGSLEMALTYIGTSQDDVNIVDLRERLFYALGRKQQQQRQSLNSLFGQPKSTTPFQQNPYPTGPRLSQARTISQSSTGMSSFQNAFNTGLPNSGFSNQIDANPVLQWALPPSTQVQGQAPKVPLVTAMMNQGENLSQPQRPASVSSVGSASQQPAASLPRPKRILDPSVQSGPTYGQVQQPAVYGGAPAFNTNPIQQSAVPFAQPALNPIQQQPTMTNSWDQQSYGFQNQSNINGNVASLAPPPQRQMYKNPTPPPGWNDPPEFKQSKVSLIQ